MSSMPARTLAQIEKVLEEVTQSMANPDRTQLTLTELIDPYLHYFQKLKHKQIQAVHSIKKRKEKPNKFKELELNQLQPDKHINPSLHENVLKSKYK